MQRDAELVARVFLIRHGETVDNVAGLYAGSRDSALTNHGVLQAERLGAAFAKDGPIFTHIFSSPLSRAFKTAEHLTKAQQRGCDSDIDIVQCAELREQDFGYYEGKSFSARTSTAPPIKKLSGGSTQSDQDTIFQDVESKESMAQRADAFLDKALQPLLEDACARGRVYSIAIVSHGMLLSSLWKRLLKRQGTRSVTLHPDMEADHRPVSLEHLGGWVNTGYLELQFLCKRSQSPKLSTDEGEIDQTRTPAISSKISVALEQTPQEWPYLALHVMKINCKAHLLGLKRTRGGVGSSKHDEGQKSIDSFFKKRKVA